MQTNNDQRIQKLNDDKIAEKLVVIMKHAFKRFLNDIKIANSQELGAYLRNYQNDSQREMRVRDDLSKLGHVYLAKQIQSKHQSNKISLSFKPKFPGSRQKELQKYHISTFKPNPAVSFLASFPSPGSKAHILIDGVRSYLSLLDDPSIQPHGSNIIQQELPPPAQQRDCRISYLYTVFERARHGCSVLGSVLADHFCRTGLIVFKKDVLARVGNSYPNKWGELVTENDPPYGVMTATNTSSKSNTLVGKTVRQKKIMNVIKLLFGRKADNSSVTLSDQHLLFRGHYSLDRLIDLLGRWLDVQFVDDMSLLANQFSLFHLNDRSHSDADLAKTLEDEFLRLLAVEYKVYFENESDIPEVRPVDLHVDDIFSKVFGRSNF